MKLAVGALVLPVGVQALSGRIPWWSITVPRGVTYLATCSRKRRGGGGNDVSMNLQGRCHRCCNLTETSIEALELLLQSSPDIFLCALPSIRNTPCIHDDSTVGASLIPAAAAHHVSACWRADTSDPQELCW